MSRNINVNPGQYKVAGRERQGENVLASEHRAARSIKEQELRQKARRAPKNSGRRRSK